MPENTVYVGRPTKWGNPYKMVGDMIYEYKDRGVLDPWVFHSMGEEPGVKNSRATAEKVVQLYRGWLIKQLAGGQLNLREVRGKNLACFCKEGEPCHADALLHAANSIPEYALKMAERFAGKGLLGALQAVKKGLNIPE